MAITHRLSAIEARMDQEAKATYRRLLAVEGHALLTDAAAHRRVHIADAGYRRAIAWEWGRFIVGLNRGERVSLDLQQEEPA